MTGLLAGLHWAHPWAWLCLGLPLGLALWRRRARGLQAREALAYADAHLHAWALHARSPRAGLARRMAEALLWLLTAAALAGPRQLLALDAAGAARAQHRVDVMVVLRVPARDTDTLAASRMALHELQRRLQGERLGLVVYRRGAGLLLPCTDDPALFDDFLDRAGPALLGESRGDGLPAALWLARRELAREPGASRAVLLLAGAGVSPEDSAGAAGPRGLEREARGLEAARLPLFLLWTGPGEIDPALQALARRSGGASAALDSPQAWTLLYGRGIARLPSNPAPPGSEPVWRELYALPLAAALLLLAWLQVPQLRRARATIPPALLLLAALGLAGTQAMLPRAQAGEAPAHQEQAWAAWQAWSRHDYAACARLYAGLPGFDAHLGEGDCAYRAGRWPQAAAAFRRAMLGTPDDARRALALYNLGNAAFHLQGGLREAIDAYRASLALRPGDPGAVRNLRLAQAQWAQEHPEQAMAAMRKRGTPQGAGRFGDTADTTPSSMAARRKPRQAQGYQDTRLQAGGRLQASGVQPGSEAPGLALDPAELRAARRAVPWLHDHRGALLRALVRQDSGEAADRPEGP
ncbi:tetratricopeptide repeat protein [Thiomonas sp. FB-6]|uniref:tetratricopeptide repeat protein n=1 Tax=Thiomonas sp. FB-6 TaxID=1158291 RepID=UPI0003A3749C|nr:tetratricopeptide repeat protein [Thiomonas sp. FB-6]